MIKVANTRVAEMVKLLENTFRAVNIGLVNEIALMCHRLDIDVWEVIDAAGTKPFGFMPFYPGPGLGGHCIPIDPFYLSWKARQSGFECRFIELAGHVNGAMPEFVVERVTDALNSAKKSINGSKIHMLGHGVQEGCRRRARVARARHSRTAASARRDDDVHATRTCPSLKIDELSLTSVDPAKADADCAVICTNHSSFDYDAITKKFPLIVDTRNALRGRRREGNFSFVGSVS